MTDRARSRLQALAAEVRACHACDDLPYGPRPIFQAAAEARILIIGQAPGRRVHDTGIPWNDPSGDRLRSWLGVDRAAFYGPAFAIIPMGLCYPGSGPRGDHPPRRRCAPLWFARLRTLLPDVRLTLLIGRYAQAYHLTGPGARHGVAWHARRGPHYGAVWPLPHPSGRNNAWLARHPWFAAEILPALQIRVREALSGGASSAITPPPRHTPRPL
ncbi:uracil-DNA glycosylase family protein [Acidiferrobacter sp.]|uniref:uracil-DNA glycosylase family protein n=1 Tax=Acidiferrobacter sp. TaxID=1872107 RepID=UPI00261E41F7|nr:uracil-DNA glycosylase family protein [Acidiferrobacter sp.]